MKKIINLIVCISTIILALSSCDSAGRNNRQNTRENTATIKNETTTQDTTSIKELECKGDTLYNDPTQIKKENDGVKKKIKTLRKTRS